MLQLKDKLIVVGMKYQGKDAENALVKLRLPGVTTTKEVALELEQNNNAPFNVGIRVIYEGKHIGYVRNLDIPSSVNLSLWDKFGMTKYVPIRLPNKYKVTTVNNNYLVIVENKNYTFDADHNTDALRYAADKISSLTLPVENNWVTETYEFFGLKDPKSFNSNKSEETKMNTSFMKDNFFREVTNAAIDIQSGKFGIFVKEGIAVFNTEDKTISVNPIVDMGIRVPAFAMRVNVSDIKVGDIVFTEDEASFLQEINEKGTMTLVSPSGEVKTTSAVKNLFFGNNTVMAIKNFFGSDTNNMLMMAMMMGDKKDFDMKTFAMMSMLGGQPNSQGINPLMFALMMK